ncbi:MAG: PIN domain-containing protein [Bryobacteraceae bacterium]
MSNAPAEFCLDASALLALMQQEPGFEIVAATLDRAVMHSVNVLEVLRKLTRNGLPPEVAVELFEELHINVIEQISMRHLKAATALIDQSKSLRLSLGDCVCLMLGEELNCTILTSEKSWSKVHLRAGTVRQIR